MATAEREFIIDSMVAIRLEEEDEVNLLSDCVRGYQSELHNAFHRLLADVTSHFVPPQLQAYLDELTKLSTALDRCREQAHDGPFEISDRFASVLRNAVIWRRLALARSVEMRRAKVVHPDLLKKLDAELEPYEAYLNSPWFQQAESKPVPQLTEFFAAPVVDAELAREQGPERAREYDEKFNILQAPSLFLYDLERARRAAALRGVLVAAAYLDIDRFKDFNAEKGEPFIDRHVLPKFMRTIEAHLFTRGHAYRYGGDEYAVLIRNTTEDEALDSMNRLRTQLGSLKYEGTQRSTTVSIGVVIVRVDCHLTEHEIEVAAAAAKQFAKNQGRDRVATYNTPRLRGGDLRITGALVV